MARSLVFAKFIILFANIVFLCIVKDVQTHRLNVPRVLLPVFNDFAVNFTIEVTDDGCYHWSTSRLDIIQLIPVNEDLDRTCSSAIVVQTVTRDLTRNTAIILAEDVNTGQFLRCDIIVDAIFSLNLVTTTRELYIEESPEAFEVRAYDDQGNQFTTLAGVEFLWEIGTATRYSSPSNNKPTSDVLRFLSYQESHYETPHTVAAFDAVGKTGHIVLLEGIKTGTAKVSVRLPYPEYRHVPPIEVELLVIANLIIIPSDVTIMAHDSFKYKIMQAHEGRLEEISLPSSQYYLEAENPNVLEIDNDYGSAYALSLGKTKVFLHDKNVREEYSVVLPSATVHVNTVAYISLTVMPNRNWALILGQMHEIIVELYDSKDHKFQVGEGVEVKMKIDEFYFDPKLITQNGTYVAGVPIKCGTMTVEAHLHGIIDKQGRRVLISPPLSTKADLTIHTPVRVQPSMLVVPWDSKSKSRYNITLKASGGEGSYIWSSKNPSIVAVSQSGGVKVVHAGSTEITVAMARNQYNKDTCKVHVLLPSKLKIIDYSIEAAVGEPIHLHVALFGKLPANGTESKEIPFTECNDVNFEVFIPDGNFVRGSSEDEQPVGIACAVITVMSLNVGTSDVTVAYNVDGKYLTDNITVSAYERLIAIHPDSSETVLAVGSSRKIIFKGGPRPWPTRPQGYKQEIKMSDDDIAEVTEHKLHLMDAIANIAVFQVTCKALGVTDLKYTLSNIPVLANCKSTSAIATVKIICGKPRYIQLHPEFENREKCPIDHTVDTTRIMAQSKKDLKMLVSVRDADGRTFDNITSLSIQWSLKPSTNGVIRVPLGSIEETFTDFDVTLPKGYYQYVVFKTHSGTFTINAKVTGYQKQVLSKLKIIPEWPAFPVTNRKGVLETPIIETSIDVVLVNDTSISPSKLTILNDPNEKYYLQVIQGSGYYDLMLSSEDIADIRYLEATKTINITPKKAGILQIALIDLCLPSLQPAEATIHVQELALIEVETVNKVEKNKCVVASLKLYDTEDQLIKLPSLTALEFKTEIDNSNIDIKQLPQSEQGSAPYERILYMIHGIEEGSSQITFVHKSSEHEVQSEPIPIQVFLPLKVYPRNLTVLVGTIYQITTLDGPVNADIEFLTENKNILHVNQKGIFEGKSLGQTRIIARAVGFDLKGTKVVYSESFADIYVMRLEGIKIVLPTSRIKVGATLPLWAFGIPEHLTPLVLGSTRVPLIFSWFSSDSNILSLHNMYEGTGINIRYHNEVSVRAKAVGSGLVTVYLNVTVPTSSNVLSGFKSDLALYTTTVKIEVFQELHLTNPAGASSLPVILMAPHSALKLQTNRDKYGVTTYKILSSAQSSDSDDPNALSSTAKMISIDKNGIIRSGESFGRTVISLTNAEAYHLKQTLSVLVEVKPVHYMMLSLKSNLRIRSGEELDMLPKGLELIYALEYYDNVGNKFHAAEMKFKTTANRADLAVFAPTSGDTLAAKFIENGELIVKVYNEKHANAMFDYVHMMIGDILFPTKTTLTVGDVICFSMPLLSPDGDPGYWQSSAPEILSVDPLTGIGKAQNVGHVVVKHSLATNMQGETEIIVQPISKVSIVPLKGKNITGTETFSVPLVLKNKDEQIKENNVLARGLGGCRTFSSFTLTSFPYTCSIQFVTPNSYVGIKDLFIAKPRFDIVTGFYYCDVIPMGSPSIASSTLETRIQINAQSRDIEGNPIEVNYLPPVYISSKEIVFTDSQPHTVPTATFDIYGLRTVLEHVTINVPEGIAINERQFISKSRMQYKLRLMHNQDEIQGQKAFIVNDLTKQNISLFIRVSKYDNFVPLSGIHWLDYIYFHRYTFITFAVIIVTFFYVWKNKMTNIDLTVKNRNVFAEKCPPSIKKTSAPCSPTTNYSTASTPASRTPTTPLRPFSAFEPVYGDPRGFYTPSGRRNRSLNCP